MCVELEDEDSVLYGLSWKDACITDFNPLSPAFDQYPLILPSTDSLLSLPRGCPLSELISLFMEMFFVDAFPSGESADTSPCFRFPLTSSLLPLDITAEVPSARFSFTSTESFIVEIAEDGALKSSAFSLEQEVEQIE
ncbi:hypothetical protein ACB094_03G061600 [Castanea mollissima]